MEAVTASTPLRRALLASTIAMLTLGFVLSSAPFAQAQTVPEEADPATDVAGPAINGVAGPVCSSLTGGLALALVVAATVAGEQAGQVNPIYQALLAAQVAACGIVPPQPTRTTCGPDAEVGEALATAAAPADSAGAPVDPTTAVPRPRLTGGTVGSVHAAEDLATDNGVPAPGAGDAAASTLSCETIVVGGEFVPLDPAARSATASGSAPPDAVVGPSAGQTDAPVVNHQGGDGLATGVAAPPDDRLAELARVEGPATPAAGPAVAATAGNASESGVAGKVAALIVLGLLTALSFIPTPRTATRRP